MGKYLTISGANFEAQKIETVNFIDTYDLILSTYPKDAGYVLGSGVYPKGQQVQILALNTNPLYSFNKWDDNNENSLRNITLTYDTVLTAQYDYHDYTITDYSSYGIKENFVMGTDSGVMLNYIGYSSLFVSIPKGASTLTIGPAPSVPEGTSVTASALICTKNAPIVAGEYAQFATDAQLIRPLELSDPINITLASDANYVYISYAQGEVVVAPTYIKFSK